MKKTLPVTLTESERVWGNRYLLFELCFLPMLLNLSLQIVLPFVPAQVTNLLFYATNFIAVIGIFHRYLAKAVAHLRQNWLNVLITAAIGFGLYWLLSTGLTALIHALDPDFFNVNDANISTQGRDNLLLIAISTVILVPTAEEMLYRGVVFGLMHRRNRFLAYAISIVLFCSIHVFRYISMYEPLHLALCFVQYIPAGLILALTYAHSGSIFAPILIHTAVNLVGVLSMR